MTFPRQNSHNCLFLQTAKYFTILTPESILTFASMHDPYWKKLSQYLHSGFFFIIFLWNPVNIKHLSMIKIDAKVKNFNNEITVLTTKRRYMNVFKDDI